MQGLLAHPIASVERAQLCSLSIAAARALTSCPASPQVRRPAPRSEQAPHTALPHRLSQTQAVPACAQLRPSSPPTPVRAPRAWPATPARPPWAGHTRRAWGAAPPAGARRSGLAAAQPQGGRTGAAWRPADVRACVQECRGGYVRVGTGGCCCCIWGG